MLALTGKYVRGVPDEPMDPVENRPFRRVRMRPERGENGLEKRENGGDDAQQCVSLAGTRLHPFAELDENARGTGQRQDPSKHHQQTMPLQEDG